MLRLDPRFFSFQNKDRNIRALIFYYEENNYHTLFDYLVSLSNKLISLFPILNKKLGCHCDTCNRENNSTNVVSYFKSFNYELAIKHLNTFLMSTDVKDILRKCQAINIGEINGDINQSMGIYIVEDAEGIALQLLFDFDHDNAYWFSLEEMDYLAAIIQSTNMNYLSHYFEIKKDAKANKTLFTLLLVSSPKLSAKRTWAFP
ncbi:hypothetical protein [Legionella gresilensis]|uniref:hypothetical protein n=1 Tax=Legionella gresilensis TaxID=91823 RepID=UPI0010419D11|nr:hypothetical protein [Legionella gresilensis]